MTKRAINLSANIADDHSGQRLDQALAQIFPEHSRARLQTWIKQGNVTVDNKHVTQRHILTGGEHVLIAAELEAQTEEQPEAIDLDILFEDTHLLVLNKAAGLVTHPGAGNKSGTLLNALLHHHPDQSLVARAGIVHRLDKDTSGLMMVAKTPEAHTALVEALQNREIKRNYQALVRGTFTAGGTVDQPIGRHPKHRTRMAVVHSGKPAVTHYRVLQKFQHFTLLNCELETGRTHQIRVHMAHILHPIVGDPLYAGRFQRPKGCTEQLAETLRNFQRQALHAWKLSFIHPHSGEEMTFSAELPEDMQLLLKALEHGDMA